MNKFITATALVVFAVVGITMYNHISNSAPAEKPYYEIQPEGYHTTLRVEKESKLVVGLLHETIFVSPKGKTHCLTKVRFGNFTTGYIMCGHQIGIEVYHMYGSPSLPDQMYFTAQELAD